LQDLAEATGGACEFATPGEALEAAAARMLVRIRQQPWCEARIDWGCEPVWQTALPSQLFGGDTVIALAGLPAHATTGTVCLLAVGGEGASIEVARARSDAVSTADTLPRIAAARRIATADDAAKDTPEEPACRKYFMHGLGHSLGLGVHDLAPLNGPFQPGWVITVEPGIYIPEEGIGVRLENDILVTTSGPVDLSAQSQCVTKIELAEVDCLRDVGVSLSPCLPSLDDHGRCEQVSAVTQQTADPVHRGNPIRHRNS
jgi:hypothetical protein